MVVVETFCNFTVLLQISFSFVDLGKSRNDECTAVSRKRLIYSEGKNIIVVFILYICIFFANHLIMY